MEVCRRIEPHNLTCGIPAMRVRFTPPINSDIDKLVSLPDCGGGAQLIGNWYHSANSVSRLHLTAVLIGFAARRMALAWKKSRVRNSNT